MKKLLVVLVVILTSISAQSQSISKLKKEISILKQQNKALKEKVVFCKLYNNSNVNEVKSFSPNFDFKVLECSGNSIEQTVEIVFTIKHNLPNQRLGLWTGQEKPIAYGETGKSYKYKEAKLPNASSMGWSLNFSCPTGLLIQGKLIFRNVLPQTEKFKLVKGGFDFCNEDGGDNKGKGRFEIRNININWKQ